MHQVPSSWNPENLGIRQNPLCKLDCSFRATFKAYSYSYLISSIQVTLMATYLKALTRHCEVLLERLHLFFKCQSEGDVPWLSIHLCFLNKQGPDFSSPPLRRGNIVKWQCHMMSMFNSVYTAYFGKQWLMINCSLGQSLHLKWSCGHAYFRVVNSSCCLTKAILLYAPFNLFEAEALVLSCCYPVTLLI